MSIRKEIKVTSVITDIRGFSENFKKYQIEKSDIFLKFIDEYYKIQTDISSIISDETYSSSTGDGVLTLFLSDNNHNDAYTFIISVHKALSDLCDRFNKENGTDISFGIGADSGNVYSVGKGRLETFVGTVINRSSRIEGKTKGMGNTKTLIGNTLYKMLIKDSYPNIYDKMDKYDTYDSLLDDNPLVVLASKKFMLYYLHDMNLQGIQDNAPLFRLSESLINKKGLLEEVLTKINSNKKEIIVGYLNR